MCVCVCVCVREREKYQIMNARGLLFQVSCGIHKYVTKMCLFSV